MSEIRTQFVRNLKRLMYENDKVQSDIVHDLGFSQSTVCDWMAGRAYPRPEKMQKLADYLGVPMTVLTGVSSSVRDQSYVDDTVQALRDNPRLRLLFDKTKRMSAKDMDAVMAVVNAILKEQDEND